MVRLDQLATLVRFPPDRGTRRSSDLRRNVVSHLEVEPDFETAGQGIERMAEGVEWCGWISLRLWCGSPQIGEHDALPIYAGMLSPTWKSSPSSRRPAKV